MFSIFFTKSQGFFEKNEKISRFCMNQTWQVCDMRRERGEFGNSVNSTVLLPKQCLFCKNDQYVKRIKERLVACLNLRAVQSIKRAVTKINDFQMFGLIANDLIAKEAHYHSSCYKLYAQVNQNNVNPVTTDQN